MTRGRILAMLGATLLLALAFQPWHIAERSAERYLLSRLSAEFGLGVEAVSGGAVALLPVPRVIATGVRVVLADGDVTVSTPRLRADLDLGKLLTGRIGFDRLTLVSPQIDVRLGPDGVDPMVLLASQAAANWPAMPRISVVNNGSVFFREGPGIVSSLRDVVFEVSARDTGEALQAEGSLVWRGERLALAVATNSATRATLPMASLRSDLLNLDFRGRRRTAASPPGALEGALELNAPSLSRLGSWLNSRSPLLLPLGATKISGVLTIDRDGAQIKSASVTLGSDPMEGALDWRRRDRRWLLSGTFAGKSLDIGQPGAGVDTGRLNWPDLASAQPLDPAGLLSHDIDVRLSLQRVRLARMTLTDVAAQVMASEEKFDVAVTLAALHRGTVRGRISVARAADTDVLEARSQMTAEKVDFGLMTAELFGTRRLSGIGSFQYQVESTGTNAADLVKRAEGRVALSVRNGDFAGTNLNDAMRRIERQPLAAARDWRGGRTAFEQITLGGAITGGHLAVREGRVAGPAFKLALDGKVNLTEQSYLLTGTVQPATGPLSVPFQVLGPLGDPFVQVNSLGLLEGSGAAAPLFGKRAD
jgi:AsmA protein